MDLTRRTSVRAASVASLSLLALGGTLSSATAAAPDELVACVTPRSGELRMISPGEACERRENKIRWQVRGAAGDDGAVGPVGATGVMGPAGPAGPAGERGPTGATGTMGPVGAIGPIGAMGPTGAVGATGATGATGADGAAGPTGSAGSNGSNGSAGSPGEPGDTGATGPAGPSGAPGATGATGAAGGLGTVTVRSAQTTLPANGNAFVTASCESGEVATGFGFEGISGYDTLLRASVPLDDGTAPTGPNAWRAEILNNDPPLVVTLSVVCVDATP